jgi:hypothetical protein
VDDFYDVVAQLKSRGVVFEEYDSPGVKTVDGIGPAPEWCARGMVQGPGRERRAGRPGPTLTPRPRTKGPGGAGAGR